MGERCLLLMHASMMLHCTMDGIYHLHVHFSESESQDVSTNAVYAPTSDRYDYT